MEIVAGLKQMEGQLSIICDKTTTVKAKLEDLLFRAQRIASSTKNGMKSMDTMYGFDLQHFRRALRAFSQELQSLPVQMGSLERTAQPSPQAAKFAQSVMRLAMKLVQSLRSLQDMGVLAHQHIRTADHKIEAWYIVQEIEELVMRAQGLPTTANKIVIAVSPADSGGTPPAGAPPAAPGQ